MPSDKRQRQKARQREAREAQLAAERRRQQRRTWMTIGGLVLLVVALAALYSFVGGDDGDDTETTTGETPTEGEGGEGSGEGDESSDGGEAGESGEDSDETDEAAADPLPCPPTDGSAEQTREFPAPPPDCLEEGVDYQAVFDTTAGEIRVDLAEDETPGTVSNFVYLARYDYYDDTALFRSNTGIDILQGGAPTNSSTDPGPGYTIEDEGVPHTYEPGDLAMANTGAPNSAGAQFFFSTGPETSNLDDPGTWVVFGEVIEGMDVLESIMASHEDAEDATPGEGAPQPLPIVDDIQIVEA